MPETDDAHSDTSAHTDTSVDTDTSAHTDTSVDTDTAVHTDTAAHTDTSVDTSAHTDTSVDTDTGAPLDVDGDTFTADVDCDDADPYVHPGVVETCDGVDNDCDAATVEAGLVTAQGANFGAIQAAVDAAPVGGTVAVCSGSYAENLVIPSDLVLVGVGATRPIVDAGGVGSAVRVTGGTVELRHLVFTGGRGTDHATVLLGGGVDATDAAALTVDDCVFRANSAANGAGLAGNVSGLTRISASSFEANSATKDGGGVLLYAADVTDVTFIDNTAFRGGALVVAAAGTVNAARVDATGNHATDRGGVAYLGAAAAATWTDSEFVGNTSQRYAAGMYADVGSHLDFVRGVFDANQATAQGGALYLMGCVATADHTTFFGNSGRWGGVAMVFADSSFSLTEPTVRYQAAEMGSAFYINLRSRVDVVGGVVGGNTGLAGGAARLSADATFTVSQTDVGEGADDNVPDDVSFAPPGGSVGGLGVDVTRVCSTVTNSCD